ncbi:nucleoside recognition domain-containing protein [Anaerosinus massiliensis]|uniref:nucleoside recognition domain-containing protein n=1 Tax=Massilibacillus massiliensis TaxID=1806837 RepID=UPI000DA61C91|nr:nucleoside recognition domain-containing protein [Massilibacillus massiliensis]
MKEQQQQTTSESTKLTVPWYGFVALIFAILFFSGIFNSASGALKALDFSALLGKYGSVQAPNGGLTTFTGKAGLGARDGFLFALSLAPSVMLALGVVEIVTHLQGLKAAQKLLTPILRPLLGIPGIAGLALISSLQSTDAGAGMTKALRTENQITDKERLIFCQFQFSAGGTITNYLATGSALFAALTVPIILPLVVLFAFKIFGANLMRIYLKRFSEEAVK